MNENSDGQKESYAQAKAFATHSFFREGLDRKALRKSIAKLVLSEQCFLTGGLGPPDPLQDAGLQASSLRTDGANGGPILERYRSNFSSPFGGG